MADKKYHVVRTDKGQLQIHWGVAPTEEARARKNASKDAFTERWVPSNWKILGTYDDPDAAEKKLLEAEERLRKDQAKAAVRLREELAKEGLREKPAKEGLREELAKEELREEPAKEGLGEEPAKEGLREELAKEGLREELAKEGLREELAKSPENKSG